MKSIILAACLMISSQIMAQDETVKKIKEESTREIKKDEKDTIPKIWRKGGILNINLAQGTLSIWAAGGYEFSFSVNTILSVYAFYKEDRFSWVITLDFNLGFLYTSGLGT